MRPQIEEIVAPRRPIFLEHPPDPVPRYGYGKPPHPELAALIEQGRAGYVDSLRQLIECVDRLAAIAQRASSDPSDPTFFNRAFSGLDAVALYAFVRLLNPRTFLEIGSGNSTRSPVVQFAITACRRGLSRSIQGRGGRWMPYAIP